MRHCVAARNPFQAIFNLSISVLRKLWKSFVRGFHTSGAIRRNQTQSGAIRRNQTHSDAISMPGALCFRVFVFWAGRKGLCFVFLCFGLAQRACVLCFRVLADPPQNTARGQLSTTFTEPATCIHRSTRSRRHAPSCQPSNSTVHATIQSISWQPWLEICWVRLRAGTRISRRRRIAPAP